MSPQPNLARFGTFEFDLDSHELRRQGVRVAIEPQPAKALALFLQSPGEIVSREALKQALWKDDVHVDFDRGLAYVIGQVRSALGDSADNPRFLETLPKRGFRFIAPTFASASAPSELRRDRSELRPDGSELPRDTQLQTRRIFVVAAMTVVAVAIGAATLALIGKRPMLAVAIFDNETGDPRYDQFTNGMADAVIDRLANLDLGRLGIIGNARTLRMPRSERDLTQIRNETGATFILISVLQRQEAGIRLLSQLIRLDDGTHVWVQRFDRPGGNLDGLEAEVLAQVETGVRRHIIEGLPKDAPSSTPPASR